MEAVEANAVIQIALLAVLPLIMQGLKKIPWIESNKGWVCPLLCIAAAVTVAYFLALPQWLLVGILTGAACNKVYDWTKDIRAELLLFLIVLPAVLLTGCSRVNMSTEYAQRTRMAAYQAAEWNNRCQNGDDEACRMGLAKSSESLRLLVDAMDGVSNELE
ncbi:MAG: hypothetical protein LLF76_03110 [Planctomycetaceae bacterium]|nr:hypothetical protein [Planctomycetaceae bacterium]